MNYGHLILDSVISFERKHNKKATKVIVSTEFANKIAKQLGYADMKNRKTIYGFKFEINENQKFSI